MNSYTESSSGTNSKVKVKQKTATMTNVGVLHEYHQNNDFSQYSEILEQHFLANSISEEEKKRALFLAASGESTYTLIKNLCSPDLSSAKTYDKLITLVTNHLRPKKLIVAERFSFHKRLQGPSETFSFQSNEPI